MSHSPSVENTPADQDGEDQKACEGSLSQKELLAFQTLCEFFADLRTLYPHLKPLALYARLVEKTGIGNGGAIRRHLEIFRRYLGKNRVALEQRDLTRLSPNKIRYNDRIFCNLKDALTKATPQSRETIWKYLLTIHALLDPQSRAREILRKMREEEKGSETQVLSTIFEEISSIQTQASNPMEAMMSFVTSGGLNRVMESFQTATSADGFDLGRMVTLLGQSMGSLGIAPPQTIGTIMEEDESQNDQKESEIPAEKETEEEATE